MFGLSEVEHSPFYGVSVTGVAVASVEGVESVFLKHGAQGSRVC